MNIEEFREYCIARKGITEEFPFGPEHLVFKVMGKMFALLPLDDVPPRANLKCAPDRAVELREEYDGAITAGYHMSKVHWNTLYLQSLPPDLVRQLIDHSYNLVVNGLTKKLRMELKGL
ncbi:MAG TPA: MmcQ/YjbR family DNA-binding protein [Arenibacter sp.]|nr:MmcQ/YjbR family DNA-binding protein [Arenibacter sp.]